MLLNTLRALLRPRAEPEPPIAQRIPRLLREKRLAEAEALLQDSASERLPQVEHLALLAELRAHQRRYAEAERLCLDALRLKPGFAPAHYVLSLVYMAAARLEDALTQAIAAYNAASHTARFCAQLGLCHLRLGHYDHAHSILTQALLLDANHVPSLNNLAIACHARGRMQDALYYAQRALEIDPDYAPAKENLARFLNAPVQDLGNLAMPASHADTPDARTSLTALSLAKLEDLEERFAQAPDDRDTALELIEHYLYVLDAQSAHDILQIAQAHHPADPDLRATAARLCAATGWHGMAERLYREALALKGDHLPSLLGLARILKAAERHEEALPLLEQAAEIEPTQATLISLCSAQTHACRYPEAMQTIDRLIALDPTNRERLLPYSATCHTYLGHFDQARAELAEAAALDPYNISIRAFVGTLNLLLGNYAEGWDGYRLRNLVQPERVRLLPYPLWQGEALTDKEVLILAEQGLGDQVMFASCLPDLMAQRPRAVYLEANARIAKTLARSFPQIQVFASDQTGFDWLPKTAAPDCYLPIADLAWQLRRAPGAFPRQERFLTADPERVAYWRARLDALDARPKIGFTWRGGVQQTRRVIRSLSLDELAPLLADTRFHFVSLQYGPVQQELAAFSRTHGIALTDWPEAIADLDEFAALICALDLVITVCNTTVHFAGALGRPCWVLTPFVPEWRYGVERSDMPWYTSVHLIRQPVYGDWASVLAEVRRRLDTLADRPAESWHRSCFVVAAP